MREIVRFDEWEDASAKPRRGSLHDKVLTYITVCALSVGAVLAQDTPQNWGDLGWAAAGALIKAALGHGQDEEQPQKTAGQTVAKPTAFGDDAATVPAATSGIGEQDANKDVEKIDDDGKSASDDELEAQMEEQMD